MKLTRASTALFLSLFIGLTACQTSPTDRRMGVALEDTAISARVKSRLAVDPIVKATDVQVETFRGTVQLSGFVDSPESARRAVDLASRVEGVQEVKNALIVK
ncbi:BON domain-containing protein [Massilia glaciei]|uniref:Osmotically-inducible protein Y n=1 Tax=Massilia glaciei TaxID=1524097 RepID=A0A2U2HG13_9BURK|nr:BON domain-containing protein [Massilia glaciei]PWF43639.1 BON domain-containing protein [Massilia glaciei]